MWTSIHGSILGLMQKTVLIPCWNLKTLKNFHFETQIQTFLISSHLNDFLFIQPNHFQHKKKQKCEKNPRKISTTFFRLDKFQAKWKAKYTRTWERKNNPEGKYCDFAWNRKKIEEKLINFTRANRIEKIHWKGGIFISSAFDYISLGKYLQKYSKKKRDSYLRSSWCLKNLLPNVSLKMLAKWKRFHFSLFFRIDCLK